MERAIYFDMDGTIADLYGVDGWLGNLIAEQTKPYRMAKSLVDMRKLGNLLNHLQGIGYHIGYHIGIVSWLSKSGTEQYNDRVTKAKLAWLKKHLGAVEWDEIKIVEYGTPKSSVVEYPQGILFDDEKPNRMEWDKQGLAFDVDNILMVLESMM